MRTWEQIQHDLDPLMREQRWEIPVVGSVTVPVWANLAVVAAVGVFGVWLVTSAWE